MNGYALVFSLCAFLQYSSLEEIESDMSGDFSQNEGGCQRKKQFKTSVPRQAFLLQTKVISSAKDSQFSVAISGWQALIFEGTNHAC